MTGGEEEGREGDKGVEIGIRREEKEEEREGGINSREDKKAEMREAVKGKRVRGRKIGGGGGRQDGHGERRREIQIREL